MEAIQNIVRVSKLLLLIFLQTQKWDIFFAGFHTKKFLH